MSLKRFIINTLCATAPHLLLQGVADLRKRLDRREREQRRRARIEEARAQHVEFCPEVAIAFFSCGDDKMLRNLDDSERQVMLELREIFRTGAWELLGLGDAADDWRERGVFDPAVAVDLIEIGVGPQDLARTLDAEDVRVLVALGQWQEDLRAGTLGDALGKVGRPFLEALVSARTRKGKAPVGARVRTGRGGT